MKQVVSVVLEYAQPISTLFHYFAKHENQAALFSVTVSARSGVARRGAPCGQAQEILQAIR